MDMTKLTDLIDIKGHFVEITFLVIGLAFTGFSKKIKNWLEKKTNEKFERSINKTSLIRDNLAELRALYQADRVLLFQLHNGQYYFSGEGADKLSLTHFVVDSGVAIPDSSGTRLQNIPVTYWPEAFKIMSEKGYFYAESNAFHDPFTAQMLSVDGVKSVIMGPIKDRRGFWRGVLLVKFMSKVPLQEITEATDYGQKIGDLLSL